MLNARGHRSWLFVPGDRPERFAKALSSEADAVIVDLEDAVAPENKARARAEAVELVATRSAYVRLNGADTEWFTDDLAALSGSPGLLGVLLPKTASAHDIGRIATELDEKTPVIALIETASGVLNAAEIAAAECTALLAFGSLDFALDIGAELDDTALLHARSELVLASRAADLPGPIDGVTTDLDDPSATRRDADRARRLGFAGKLCIHPRQVAAVNQAFGHSAQTVEWARRVLAAAAAADGAAVRVDGQMIDKPRLEFARRILAATPAGEQV